MKKLLFVLLLSIPLFGMAQYDILYDSTTCLIDVTVDSVEIKWSFNASLLRYQDVNATTIQIFDGVSKISISIGSIDNYATMAALKSDLDDWSVQCER